MITDTEREPGVEKGVVKDNIPAVTDRCGGVPRLGLRCGGITGAIQRPNE